MKKKFVSEILCKVVFLVTLFLSVGCSNEGDNSKPDDELNAGADSTYDDSKYDSDGIWYDNSKEINPQYPDVFYIVSTYVWEWKDEDGTIQRYADVNNEEHREMFRPEFEYADDVFADSCNLFAPYYEQLTFESWMEGEGVIDKRFVHAMNDIQEAFDYYIEHKNNGRPFILAGYSQGGKGVIELLKTMPKDVYSRMVAAYPIGYRITSDELSKYENIKFAADSTDTGVTISYNSVENVDAICSILTPNAGCINPINWRTDATPANLNDTVTVSVDKVHNVLLVKGLNVDAYYEPSLDELFKKGNYHLFELVFYQENLKKNVRQRVNNFK